MLLKSLLKNYFVVHFHIYQQEIIKVVGQWSSWMFFKYVLMLVIMTIIWSTWLAKHPLFFQISFFLITTCTSYVSYHISSIGKFISKSVSFSNELRDPIRMCMLLLENKRKVFLLAVFLPALPFLAMGGSICIKVYLHPLKN